MSPTVGYHCSHEQHPPSEALANLLLAERAGFQSGMCSDHYFPFSQAQGHSGFAWSWLGAALQASRLELGVVNAPGQRYHPAIVAQAAATLAEMFPDRLWVALGSGQAINEHITGDPWPPKPVRKQRLLEAVQIMRALFRGETVTHEGLVRVRQARLCSRPSRPPLLVGAAVSAETAEWVGGWADALITVSRPDHQEQRQVVDAFRRGGGEGKPMFLQVKLCWAPTDGEAERLAHEQWRTNALPMDVVTDTDLPEDLDAAATRITAGDMRKAVRISSSLAAHVDWLQRDLEMGFERLYLHHVGKDQPAFIHNFGAEVLPRLRR